MLCVPKMLAPKKKKRAPPVLPSSRGAHRLEVRDTEPSDELARVHQPVFGLHLHVTQSPQSYYSRSAFSNLSETARILEPAFEG